MALLKDGTQIYGNLKVDGNIVVGTTATISGNVDITGNVTAYGTVSGVTLYGASLHFSDASIQSTAYRMARSNFNDSQPNAVLDNIQIGINLGWQAYVTCVNVGSTNVSLSLSQIVVGGSPVQMGNNLSLNNGVYSYTTPQIQFVTQNDSVTGILTDNDASKTYQVTWLAGTPSPNGYCSIQRI